MSMIGRTLGWLKFSISLISSRVSHKILLLIGTRIVLITMSHLLIMSSPRFARPSAPLPITAKSLKSYGTFINLWHSISAEIISKTLHGNLSKLLFTQIDLSCLWNIWSIRIDTFSISQRTLASYRFCHVKFHSLSSLNPIDLKIWIVP